MNQPANKTNLPIEPFTVYDESTAPEDSRETLSAVKAEFSMIPNLEGVMAGSPLLLKGYVSLWGLFAKTSFSPAERQIVYQTTNFENNCNYCVPWHSLLAKKAGLSESDVEALREGSSLSEPKHESLRRFTQALLRTDGNVSRSDLAAFFDAGYNEEQAMEVILGIATKLMSNYTNSIGQTPLDKPVEKLKWSKPYVGV
jgi:alkylhydroperoxidase family enzyme